MKSLPNRKQLVKEYVQPGSTGAEIGVYRGGFSREIFDLCDPKMIYCIDAWEAYPEYSKDSLCHTNQDDNYEATKATMAGAIAAGRCEVIRGRSHAVRLGWTDKKRPMLDWIFLDSIHTYPFVIEDLWDWSRLIKPNGVIMCHDFTERPAAIAMDFGVVRAVNEFCAQSGWEVVAVTEEADWPSCALKRP